MDEALEATGLVSAGNVPGITVLCRRAISQGNHLVFVTLVLQRPSSRSTVDADMDFLTYTPGFRLDRA